MNIATYVTPCGYINPTGMGKHGRYMTRQLGQRPDVSLHLCAARDQCAPNGRLPAGCGLEELTATRLPMPARAAHFAWRTAGWPPLDYWAGDADWVYSPIEQFVPARRARTAATIHCANWFETDLPWSDTADNLRKRNSMARSFRPILERGDLVITVSEFLKGRICELFNVKPERVAVVGNGVEDSFFGVGLGESTAAAANELSPYVFAVAYPTRRKGFDRLIELADDLARRGSRLMVKVAGSGLAQGESLDEARRSHGEEVATLLAEGLRRPNMELLGYCSSEQIAQLMRDSVAVLVLSRYETFGIPAAEAMAAGAPVIAAQFAALPGIVGRAGLIVDPAKTQELSDAVCALANSSTMRRQYVEAGRERATDYTWSACADRLVEALRRFH